MQGNQARLGLTGDEVRRQRNNKEFANLLTAMGNMYANAAEIASSEDGRLIEQRMSVMSMAEDSDECRRYWETYEKGLKKEVHGQGLDKWASYISLAAERQPERKFPLIFCLHGAHNPIQLTESYGVMQVAAREECIVLAPENENMDNILALLEYAKETYPVDARRVYCIGYSFGGFMSSRLAMEHPDLFAGVGMGGMLFVGNVREHELDGQKYLAYYLTKEMMQRVEQLKMPALLFMGENEMLNLLPLWREPVQMIKDGVIPLDRLDKQAAFNNWRRAGGCGPDKFFSEGEPAETVQAHIGADFERTEIRMYHGRKYFIGDSVNKDNECLFRTVACEKMVHCPTIVFAELVWEQISRYARDCKTGRLIRL